MTTTADGTTAPERVMVRADTLVGKTLRDLGVKDLFFMMGMGGPHSPAVRSCIDEGIAAYYIRHEEAGVMAAHAYARLTKRPGICVTPLGPGTTNALTGMVNALLDCAPVVLLAGGPSRHDWGREAYQEQDQMGMFRPACKRVVRVEVPEKIPEMLAYAYREANSGRKGPVYVEVAMDVLGGQVDPAHVRWPQPLGSPARSAVPEQDLAHIVELLASAERPLVLAGSGVLWACANDELKAFLDRSGIPLVTTPQSRGVVPEDHPLALTAARSRAQREADVVLAIGTRANWINAHFAPPRFAPDARFVVVNIDPDEIGRGRAPAVGVVADARTALQQLRDQLDRSGQERHASVWVDSLIERDASRQPSEESTSSAVPIHPERLCAEVRRALPRDAVFIIDGHETLEFGRRAIPSLSEGNYLAAGPNGCMGVGVPFALGAKVAAPDRPVFVLMGDGGFGWHGMEYDTLIRHSLPVVGIVFNNAGFTARPTAQGVGWELGYQRYDLMVAGFGGHGEFVEHPDDIAPALQRAIDSGKPALVNVCVDPEIPASGGLLGALRAR